MGFKRGGGEGRQSPRNLRRRLTDTDIAVKGLDNVKQKKKLLFDSPLSGCYWRRGRVHQEVYHECRIGRYRDIRTLLLGASYLAVTDAVYECFLRSAEKLGSSDK